VHREDLVVLIGVQQGPVGPRELRADQQALNPSDQEEHEGRRPVEDPDLLVVDGREPAPEPGGRHRAREDPLPSRGPDHGRHRSLTPSVSRWRSHVRLERYATRASISSSVRW
jgi:hypothetical protein